MPALESHRLFHLQAQPGEVLQTGSRQFRRAADRVDILDPDQKPPIRRPCLRRVQQGRIGMAQMQSPIGARSKSKGRCQHRSGSCDSAALASNARPCSAPSTALPISPKASRISIPAIRVSAKSPSASGLPPCAARRQGSPDLLRIITDQMISLQAGAAIWRRIEAEIAPFEPKTIMRKREATWLRLGLSRAKARSFKAWLKRSIAAPSRSIAFHAMSDAEIFTALTAVPGIGRWTVEIYLLANLGRGDVWPAGDLALQIAAHDAFGLEARPNEARMRALSEPWQPWRAVAARLLWAHYRSLKNMPQALGLSPFTGVSYQM